MMYVSRMTIPFASQIAHITTQKRYSLQTVIAINYHISQPILHCDKY